MAVPIKRHGTILSKTDNTSEVEGMSNQVVYKEGMVVHLFRRTQEKAIFQPMVIVN